MIGSIKYKDRSIVFILATSSNINNLKRIKEFIAHGYHVEVYSFYRDNEKSVFKEGFEIHNIGEFSNDLPYFKRLRIIYNGIKKVLKLHKNDNCIYYLIRQDIAFAYHFLSSKPYIYEEADMTHVTFKIRTLVKALEILDKKIIKHSIMSVFRSGGFLEYHFGDNAPSNTYVIPNRLDSSILKYPAIEKRPFDDSSIKFGFVGVIRYNVVKDFVKIILEHFPQHEVHFYGVFGSEKEKISYNELLSFPNCFFHGSFENPKDLPSIYSKIDLLISTYDMTGINHKYAEPNKFYESIYFRTPIIVTKGCFLSRKVEQLGIGYSVNINNEPQLIDFVCSLTNADVTEKICNAEHIDISYCINENIDFHEKLKKIL